TTSWPTSVSMIWRGLRSMSSTPSSCSSFLSCVDRVGWLTKQASAARPKCRWSATATRYWRSRRFTDASGTVGGGAAGAHREGTPTLGRHRLPVVCAVRAPAGVVGCRVCRRGPDQVVEGAERRRRPGPESDDDLLVGHGRAVTGGEDAGNRRPAPLVDDDLAGAGQLDGALQPVGVGDEADLD